jgi:alpha-mannosidase
MVKLSLPLAFNAALSGQTAYGINPIKDNGDEEVAQKWIMARGEKTPRAFSIINVGTYGLSFQKNEILITLVRSPAYSGHPIMEREIVPQDRLTPRIDQGERLFRFFLNGGAKKQRLARIDREALVRNEAPMALSFFPSGRDGSASPKALVTVEGDAIQVTAVKKSEKNDNLVLRLFEPTGQPRKVKLCLPALGIKRTVALKKFEIKTLLVNIRKKTVSETDLLENK